MTWGTVNPLRAFLRSVRLSVVRRKRTQEAVAIRTWRREQDALGLRIGLKQGDEVEVSDDWNDQHGHPKRGEKLIVSIFTRFQNSEDVWVSCVYPGAPVQDHPWRQYARTRHYPIYTHWQRWRRP